MVPHPLKQTRIGIAVSKYVRRSKLRVPLQKRQYTSHYLVCKETLWGEECKFIHLISSANQSESS